MAPAPAIEVEQLVKRFGDFTAVDALDLCVSTGEVHGFLGPNGAGKSTTIRVLLGLCRASSGRIEVLGLDPGSAPAAVTRQISYVPGNVALWPNFTGQEVLDALAGLRGAYDVATERRLVQDFALDPQRKVRTYSKGNRQKVLLVAAFAARTPLLVLDEPTSGLDPLMEAVFQHSVRDAAAQGRTVLLSSHLLTEVEELCEAVTIIRDGALVESGKLAGMRHLAASQITARLPAGSAGGVAARLLEFGVCDGIGASAELRISVARERVADVLGVLAQVRAQDITCTPASLEDLFLRHYRTAAR